MCAKFWVSTINGLGWTRSRYKKKEKKHRTHIYLSKNKNTPRLAVINIDDIVTMFGRYMPCILKTPNNDSKWLKRSLKDSTLKDSNECLNIISRSNRSNAAIETATRKGKKIFTKNIFQAKTWKCQHRGLEGLQRKLSWALLIVQSHQQNVSFNIGLPFGDPPPIFLKVK